MGKRRVSDVLGDGCLRGGGGAEHNGSTISGNKTNALPQWCHSITEQMTNQLYS